MPTSGARVTTEAGRDVGGVAELFTSEVMRMSRPIATSGKIRPEPTNLMSRY